MSSSETHLNSFHVNFSMRPRISKQKVENLTKWETPLRDFNENSRPLSFASSESNVFYKDLHLFKKKSSGTPQEIFHVNARKSLKRKSISEKNIIETDFSCLNSKPKIFCSISSDQSPLKEKKICLQKNINFNICDIQNTFEKKTLTIRSANIPHQDSNSKLQQRQYVFPKNTHIPLGEKSIFGNNALETEFLHFNVQPKPFSSFISDQSSQKEKNTTCSLKKTSFNVCDMEASFHKKPPMCDNAFNPSLGPDRDVKKPVSKPSFSLPREFSQNKKALVSSKSASFSSILPVESSFRNVEAFNEVRSSTENVFSTVNTFKEERHISTEVDQQEQLQNQMKKEVVSLMNLKCSGPSIGVGSNWVHSILQITEDHSEGKKKIPNVLDGGYCEQILKFQRRELSEKAIWEHKNGSKNTPETVLLRINAIIHHQNLVIAECSFLDKSPISEELKDTCIALLHKPLFYKQQMKTGNCFLLSPPWHLIRMKSFKCPLLLCKYFKAASLEDIQLKLSVNGKIEKNAMILPHFKLDRRNPTKDERKISEVDTSLIWKKRLNISARIQRVWNYKISTLMNNQTIYKLALLLQSTKEDFYLLCTSSYFNLNFIDWLKFVQGEEGHFHYFKNLKVSHRLERKRFPKLFKYLQSLLKGIKMAEVKQDFVYQLSIDGMTKKPSKMLDVTWPPFLSFNYQSLLTVRKNSGGRVSCRAKVLLQYGSVLYVSDESLFQSESLPYVKVYLPQSSISIFKSEINITDAFILEGDLHLDEYSQISNLHLTNEDLSAFVLRELPFTQNSKVADIVTVKGIIMSVDESSSCIWLQCNFCMNENLVQNNENVIFCEDCCLMVDQPLLKVKMSITIPCEALPNVLFNIELLSSTIKRILSLNEISYQPQCHVSDILGKEIGPLICCIRGFEMSEGSQTLCYLVEIGE